MDTLISYLFLRTRVWLLQYYGITANTNTGTYLLLYSKYSYVCACSLWRWFLIEKWWLRQGVVMAHFWELNKISIYSSTTVRSKQKSYFLALKIRISTTSWNRNSPLPKQRASGKNQLFNGDERIEYRWGWGMKRMQVRRAETKGQGTVQPAKAERKRRIIKLEGESVGWQRSSLLLQRRIDMPTYLYY